MCSGKWGPWDFLPLLVQYCSCDTVRVNTFLLKDSLDVLGSMTLLRNFFTCYTNKKLRAIGTSNNFKIAVFRNITCYSLV